jgi:hypothetical protein
MSRRSALPGAAELFRSTGAPAERSAADAGSASATATPSSGQPSSPPRPSSGPGAAPTRAERLLAEPQGAQPGGAGADDHDGPAAGNGVRTPDEGTGARTRGRSSSARGRAAAASPASRVPTGRERHDEKITVYVSVAELMDLERARLTLRGDHGLAVDRGRIVREALAMVLEDLESEGEDSTLVRRLRSR